MASGGVVIEHVWFYNPKSLTVHRFMRADGGATMSPEADNADDADLKELPEIEALELLAKAGYDSCQRCLPRDNETPGDETKEEVQE